MKKYYDSSVKPQTYTEGEKVLVYDHARKEVSLRNGRCVGKDLSRSNSS